MVVPSGAHGSDDEPAEEFCLGTRILTLTVLQIPGFVRREILPLHGSNQELPANIPTFPVGIACASLQEPRRVHANPWRCGGGSGHRPCRFTAVTLHSQAQVAYLSKHTSHRLRPFLLTRAKSSSFPTANETGSQVARDPHSTRGPPGGSRDTDRWPDSCNSASASRHACYFVFRVSRSHGVRREW